MEAVVMITMDYAEPYKWYLACLGLLLLYVGFWLAGYRWMTVFIALPMVSGLYQSCFTKGSLYCMGGWIGYERKFELYSILYGSVVALIFTVPMILCMIFPGKAEKEEKSLKRANRRLILTDGLSCCSRCSCFVVSGWRDSEVGKQSPNSNKAGPRD